MTELTAVRGLIDCHWLKKKASPAVVKKAGSRDGDR